MPHSSCELRLQPHREMRTRTRVAERRSGNNGSCIHLFNRLDDERIVAIERTVELIAQATDALVVLLARNANDAAEPENILVERITLDGVDDPHNLRQISIQSTVVPLLRSADSATRSVDAVCTDAGSDGFFVLEHRRHGYPLSCGGYRDDETPIVSSPFRVGEFWEESATIVPIRKWSIH